MAISKVNFGDETLVDLTKDTVTPEKLLSGATAHDAKGNLIVGTIATETWVLTYEDGSTETKAVHVV